MTVSHSEIIQRYLAALDHRRKFNRGRAPRNWRGAVRERALVKATTELHAAEDALRAAVTPCRVCKRTHCDLMCPVRNGII